MDKEDSESSNDNSEFNWRLLIATFLPHFAVSLAQSAIGPLAPFLQEALAISRTQIGFLTSIQFVGSTAMAMPAGVLVERLGIRRFIFWSPFFFGLCALYFSSITSFVQGMLAYLLAGFAFSFVNPATTKAIIFGFAQERRGTAIGIKQTGVPAGALLASAMLPTIALAFGWRISMIVVAVTAVLAGVLGWVLYAARDADPAEGVNGPLARTNSRADFASLWRNSNFLLSSGLQGIFSMSQFVIQAYLVLYLVESLGYSVVYAGLVMAVMQLSGAVGRILWGMMSDLLFAGRRVPTLQVIGAITVAGLTGLALLGSETPSWVIWLIASAAGAGSLGFGGTMILLRAELAGKHLAATATGVGMAIASWGVLLGPPLFGFVVDTSGSYQLAWGVMALVTLAGTLLLGFIREPQRSRRLVYNQPSQPSA